MPPEAHSLREEDDSEWVNQRLSSDHLRRQHAYLPTYASREVGPTLECPTGCIGHLRGVPYKVSYQSVIKRDQRLPFGDYMSLCLVQD